MPSWILFKYELYPHLEKMHKKYRKMRLAIVRYSKRNSESAGKKLDQTTVDLEDYARSEYSKAVYDIFAPLKPMLHDSDHNKYATWDEVFDKPFAELNELQKRYLVGLIEHDFTFELPKEYYNN